MKTATIYIDSDASTLGPDATQSDLDRYAENLAAHLAEKFPGTDITIRQTLGGGSVDCCPENDEIAEYVTDLQSGDGWTELLGSATE